MITFHPLTKIIILITVTMVVKIVNRLRRRRRGNILVMVGWEEVALVKGVFLM